MATEEASRFRLKDIGLKWYHVGFTLAYTLGVAIFPPTGVVTIAGWVGGAVGALISSSLIAGLILAGVRMTDEWRPAREIRVRIPDSGFKYGLFLSICVQLFILGTGISVGLELPTMIVLAAPVNPLIAVFVFADMSNLSKQGIEWEDSKPKYAGAALVGGFIGGLMYWKRRGRKRSAWYEREVESSEEETEEEDSESGDLDKPLDSDGADSDQASTDADGTDSTRDEDEA